MGNPLGLGLQNNTSTCDLSLLSCSLELLYITYIIGIPPTKCSAHTFLPRLSAFPLFSLSPTSLSVWLQKESELSTITDINFKVHNTIPFIFFVFILSCVLTTIQVRNFQRRIYSEIVLSAIKTMIQWWATLSLISPHTFLPGFKSGWQGGIWI
jgi:hypothetical protein